MNPHRVIQVWINQQQTVLPSPAHLSDAIAAAAVKPPFAAAVNQVFVPKKSHATHVLKEGDHIELIVPVTGG